MLFYVALAIACCIAAVVALWLVRTMLEVGTSTLRTFLPGAQSEAKKARLAHLNPNLKDTPSPWGWSAAGEARHTGLQREPTRHAGNLAEPSPRDKVPWGWRGNEGLQRSNRAWISEGIENSNAVSAMRSLGGKQDGNAKAAVGWPYREERSTISRRKRPKRRRSALGNGKPAKPWGW